ncbi:DUF3102 domain-containing protein [Mesorhizobium caraganae]|uniref:DUF3102 domain-containing protein n=1 Tax=Mesorhizobium caraganae TaxID=483206 RepID=UPI0017809EA5|nr:DUF3102 domain-containing protein [Mesorhizobium caraganae]MBM2711681.1 DUF3102 domain-containing protein [Mesorhizobium caraganae]
MLARTPFTEIEIEGVGVFRPNMWQSQRLSRLRGLKRHIAVLAAGCRMTTRQFMKLPDATKAELDRAYLALMSPSNSYRPASEPAETRAEPGGHMSAEMKLAIGRRLLQVKASLPHGHFGPWLDKQEGLSRSMAQQCMALATGGRQDARQASAVYESGRQERALAPAQSCLGRPRRPLCRQKPVHPGNVRLHKFLNGPRFRSAARHQHDIRA